VRQLRHEHRLLHVLLLLLLLLLLLHVLLLHRHLLLLQVLLLHALLLLLLRDHLRLVLLLQLLLHLLLLLQLLLQLLVVLLELLQLLLQEAGVPRLGRRGAKLEVFGLQPGRLLAQRGLLAAELRVGGAEHRHLVAEARALLLDSPDLARGQGVLLVEHQE